MRCPLLMSAAVLICATAAHGEDSAASESTWWHTSGHLSFGITDRLPGADVFLAGDATLRLSRPDTAWGVELGTFGYANALDTPHETYGTITWDLGTSRLAFGVPRPAYDSVAVSGFDALFPSFAVDQARTTRSRATWGATEAGALPYGARLDASAGPLRSAASLHWEDGADAPLIALSAETTAGALAFGAAVEGQPGAAGTLSAKLQTVWSQGPVDAGLGLFAPGAAGASTVLELSLQFAATDRVTVTGLLQAPVSEGAITAGLAATVALPRDLSLTAGGLRTADGSLAYTAALAWHF